MWRRRKLVGSTPYSASATHNHPEPHVSPDMPILAASRGRPVPAEPLLKGNRIALHFRPSAPINVVLCAKELGRGPGRVQARF